MKLTVNRTPYSSVVGGGLTLLDEAGAVTFLVMFMGPRSGITKAQNDALTNQFADWIEKYGLEAPAAPSLPNNDPKSPGTNET